MIMLAPNTLAICKVETPTAEVEPWIRMLLPAVNLPLVSGASCAVGYAIDTQGASAGLLSPGMSLVRWFASQNTSLHRLALRRNATADGAKAVKSGACRAPTRHIAMTGTGCVAATV